MDAELVTFDRGFRDYPGLRVRSCSAAARPRITVFGDPAYPDLLTRPSATPSLSDPLE